MAEGNGLLNRHRAKSLVAGSNPALSATPSLIAAEDLGGPWRPEKRRCTYRSICGALAGTDGLPPRVVGWTHSFSLNRVGHGFLRLADHFWPFERLPAARRY